MWHKRQVWELRAHFFLWRKAQGLCLVSSVQGLRFLHLGSERENLPLRSHIRVNSLPQLPPQQVNDGANRTSITSIPSPAVIFAPIRKFTLSCLRERSKGRGENPIS